VSRAGRAAADPTVAGSVATGAAGAAAARAAYQALRQRPPAGEKTWTRTNHRGELVTLLEGPAVAVGAITAEVIAAAVAARRSGRSGAAATTMSQLQGFSERSAGSHASLAMAVAGGGAFGFGVLDDLAGSGKRRGLKGHLGALAHGEVTTGTVKLAGLAATGLAGGLLLGGKRSDVVINAGLIAGGANLLNLFDLRPGRAVKVAALSAGLIAAGGAGGPDRSAGLAAVAAPLGAGLALLPEDLAERAMLGDAGANALGAMLGAAAASSLPRPARAGLLAGIVALTVASEKVSFTKVIERTPTLRRIDMLGRRPAPPTAPVTGTATSTAPAATDDHPDTAQVIRLQGRRGGRHRRVGSGEAKVRSINWLFGLFFRALARQEQ
jgi:hypothetical protein